MGVVSVVALELLFVEIKDVKQMYFLLKSLFLWSNQMHVDLGI